MSRPAETVAQPAEADASDCGGRGQRADARRNRARVLAAAREVFAERGREARMEEIAERAGVGVGTLYRNFPTKEALLGELLAASLRELAAAARGALIDSDPWAAFARVIRLFVRTGAVDRGFERALRHQHHAARDGEGRGRDGKGHGHRHGGPSDDPLRAARDEFRQALGALIARAQDAGTLRPGVAAEDVLLLFRGIAFARPDFGTPERQERCVQIILDGLRGGTEGKG